MGNEAFDKALNKYLKDGTLPADITAGEYEVEITKGKLLTKNDTEFFMLITQVAGGEYDGAEFVTTYFLRPQNIPELVRVLGGFGIKFTCYDDLKNGAFGGYRALAEVSIEEREEKDDDGQTIRRQRPKIEKATPIKKAATPPATPRVQREPLADGPTAF